MGEQGYIFKISMSSDKYQQSMENWKKAIIIDPHLNSLFDSDLTPPLFLQQRLLPLPHPTLLLTYVKLTSLTHALSKHMHKQIEVRHSLLEETFKDCLKSKSSYESINMDSAREDLRHIQKFNQKYELIADRALQIKNINKILHFAKALEQFKVNVRMLQSMMQDFDHQRPSRVQAQLLNTFKISKIVKDISTLNIKFDFSGIRSYEDQRAFLNNTKGAIFGIVQKELSGILGRLPNQEDRRKQELEKDIIHKFMVLNNIMKLKDFCTNYYKNTMKEMSELLKKSLVIGQSADEHDPKSYLQTFEEYFTVSLRKRLIENAVVFLTVDQLLGRSGIKTPFNFSFFEKYWQNITSFMRDLIGWSVERDGKESEGKEPMYNIDESFHILQTKGNLSRQLMSIIWKYPILYHCLGAISNEVHLHILKHSQFNHYQFHRLREHFLAVLLPLAKLYYHQVGTFYKEWSSRLMVKINAENQPLNSPVIIALLLDEGKTGNSYTINILEWFFCCIRTKEIFDYHSDQLLPILNNYITIVEGCITSFNSQRDSKQEYTCLIEQWTKFTAAIKRVLTRGGVSEGQFDAQLSHLTSRQGVLGSSCQRLVGIIQVFKKMERTESRFKSLLQ